MGSRQEKELGKKLRRVGRVCRDRGGRREGSRYADLVFDSRLGFVVEEKTTGKLTTLARWWDKTQELATLRGRYPALVLNLGERSLVVIDLKLFLQILRWEV